MTTNPDPPTEEQVVDQIRSLTQRMSDDAKARRSLVQYAMDVLGWSAYKVSRRTGVFSDTTASAIYAAGNRTRTRITEE